MGFFSIYGGFSKDNSGGGGTTISGTPFFIPRFNAAGNNIEDTFFLFDNTNWLHNNNVNQFGFLFSSDNGSSISYPSYVNISLSDINKFKLFYDTINSNFWLGTFNYGGNINTDGTHHNFVLGIDNYINTFNTYNFLFGRNQTLTQSNYTISIGNFNNIYNNYGVFVYGDSITSNNNTFIYVLGLSSGIYNTSYSSIIGLFNYSTSSYYASVLGNSNSVYISQYVNILGISNSLNNNIQNATILGNHNSINPSQQYLYVFGDSNQLNTSSYTLIIGSGNTTINGFGLYSIGNFNNFNFGSSDGFTNIGGVGNFNITSEYIAINIGYFNSYTSSNVYQVINIGNSSNLDGVFSSCCIVGNQFNSNSLFLLQSDIFGDNNYLNDSVELLALFGIGNYFSNNVYDCNISSNYSSFSNVSEIYGNIINGIVSNSQYSFISGYSIIITGASNSNLLGNNNNIQNANYLNLLGQFNSSSQSSISNVIGYNNNLIYTYFSNSTLIGANNNINNNNAVSPTFSNGIVLGNNNIVHKETSNTDYYTLILGDSNTYSDISGGSNNKERNKIIGVFNSVFGDGETYNNNIYGSSNTIIKSNRCSIIGTDNIIGSILLPNPLFHNQNTIYGNTNSICSNNSIINGTSTYGIVSGFENSIALSGISNISNYFVSGSYNTISHFINYSDIIGHNNTIHSISLSFIGGYNNNITTGFSTSTPQLKMLGNFNSIAYFPAGVLLGDFNNVTYDNTSLGFSSIIGNNNTIKNLYFSSIIGSQNSAINNIIGFGFGLIGVGVGLKFETNSTTGDAGSYRVILGFYNYLFNTYNDPNDYVLMIGNGTSSASRSSCLYLSKQGRLGIGNNLTTTPNSTIHNFGSLSESKITSVNATNYTALESDLAIYCSGNCTITLPPISNSLIGIGKVYEIISNGTGTVSINTSGSDTIEETLTTYNLVGVQSLRVKAIANNKWRIL
ncbi:MAG: hypothetical protein QW474_00140 [Candidatus Aenigmatarchaeota archaeon]